MKAMIFGTLLFGVSLISLNGLRGYEFKEEAVQVEQRVIPVHKETKVQKLVKNVKKIEKKKKEQKPSKRDDWIEWTVTAYCPCEECSGNYGTETSTGRTAREGRTIAVDPDVIQYGSKVEIDGKRYIAEDCGGAVKGYTIDIYFDTHEEVEKFGKRTDMKVKVIK